MKGTSEELAGRPPPLLHPEHDAIVRDVHEWYTKSVPEIGYEVTRERYGYRSLIAGTNRVRLIIRVDSADEVLAALSDARASSGGENVTAWVDDKERAAGLGSALRSSGTRPGAAVTYLALVGTVASRPGPENLVVENTDEARLEEWAVSKLQSFADAETAPAPHLVAHEVTARRREMAWAVYQLGLLDGDGVAVLAYYPGPDQLVFSLGTRVPFRHRAIAQAMLARWAHAGMISGCRSLMINAREHDRPAELYRRLGFVDEVYWYQPYELV
jgi:hypothetical protein